MNCAQLVGRLTAEPELKQTQNGKSVLNITVAVQRDKEDADFIDCVAWGKTAEYISSWFHKGSWIAVEGTITTRNYEDKNGNKRKATEVTIARAGFCSNKSDAQTPSTISSPTDTQVEETYSSGNLPF